MKKLKCKQQWKSVCDFVVSLHVLNFIIYDWSVHLLTCQNQIKVFMIFFFLLAQQYLNNRYQIENIGLIYIHVIEVLSIAFGSMINIIGPPV